MAPPCRHRAAVAALALAALVGLLGLLPARGQGLKRTTDASYGTDADNKQLVTDVSKRGGFLQAYASNPKGACNNASGLCANDADQYNQELLLMATSPARFDSRIDQYDMKKVQQFNPIGEVQNQGACSSCVAFASLAAAQAAVACAMQQNAPPPLSVQDFFFCKSVQKGEVRTCNSILTTKEGVQALGNLRNDPPVLEKCLSWSRDSTKCPPKSSYSCTTTADVYKNGQFTYKQISTFAQAQEHIRQHGMVLAGIQLWDDLRPFFLQNPSGIYYGPAKGVKAPSMHAIALVGYDLDKEYWIARNSWGSGWGQGGYFNIAFSMTDLSVADTFGVMFQPDSPPSTPTDRLTTSKSRQGCCEYRTSSHEYVSRVAQQFDVPIRRLLLDNLDTIKDPGALLSGQTLFVCGVKCGDGSWLGSMWDWWTG